MILVCFRSWIDIPSNYCEWCHIWCRFLFFYIYKYYTSILHNKYYYKHGRIVGFNKRHQLDEQGVPDAVQPEAYFRYAMKCIITELAMGCILLFLEAAIAITEYTIGQDEDKNKGAAKGFAIGLNVLSFRLFVFLLCKFHCRAKAEKATLRWKYVYVWIDPMTQEVWQMYTPFKFCFFSWI